MLLERNYTFQTQSVEDRYKDLIKYEPKIIKRAPLIHIASYLGLAILFEVVGSSFMKASNGFTKLLPTVVVAVAYLICFYFLSLSLKTIPLGTAYAIWGGLGIVLTALVSVLIFKQSIDFPAIAGIALIVTGVFVINFFSKTAVH